MLKEMIFPNCEKLGQTIIFVRRCVCVGGKGAEEDGCRRG